MNFSRFNSSRCLHNLLLVPYLMLLGLSLSAQTISGTVYDACRSVPIAGAELSISYHPPGGAPVTDVFHADQNGFWNYSFFHGAPDVLYTIRVLGGASSPSQYFYHLSDGDQSGLDFNLLPKNWDITINGEEIFWQNNPQSPLTLCQNQNNCLQLTGLNGAPFEPMINHCFQVRLFATDDSGAAGELLASSLCQNFTRPSFSDPCGDQAFDLNELLRSITALPPLIRLEVWHYCCNRECQPNENDLLNKEVAFVEVLEIGPAQACFMFEDPNGVDLIEPGTDCQNAVAYCQVDVDVDGTCSSGAIDHYWIEVSEYDINTCEFIRVLADGSSNPTTIGSLAELDGINLNNYVRDHWVADPNPQWPYFYLASNPPRNFEVTLFVENACGTYSRTGWFNNSIQCLTGGGNDQNNLITPPTSNNRQAIIDDNIELLIYPNPVSDISNLRFQMREEEEVFIEVKSISGEILKKVEVGVFPKGINEFSMDFSGLPSGTYTLTVCAGDEAKVVKIAKI